MIIDLDEYDLIKASTWREDLHPRDKNGRFSKTHSWTVIRKGSKVVAKNGTSGKVTGVSDTHYTIERDDGKTSRILKHNVIHETDHQKLSKKAGAKSGNKNTKQAGESAGKQPGASRTSSKEKTAKAGQSAKAKRKGAEVDEKVSTKSKKSPARKKRGTAVKPASSGTADTPATTTKPTTAKSRAKTPSKTVKGDSTSAPKKPTTTKKGTGKRAGASANTKSKSDGRTVQGTKKAPAKNGAKNKADIRSGAQKNRSLAYDVGDKVGGARKDDYEARFKEKPTMANLDKLEKDNGAIAEKLVTKSNLLPKFDFEQEHKNGVDLPTAIMKKLLQDRIDQKPQAKTPEARKDYMTSLQKFQRHFEGIKSWDTMRNAIREFSDLASKGLKGRASDRSLESYQNNPNRWSYFNDEYHQEASKRGAEARAMMDFAPLGEKFEGFFTDYKKRESSLNTVAKNTKEGWDKYLNPETKKPTAKPKDGNKKWERKAEAEHLRTGGKKVTMNKPEELIKTFGVRGVEFGHWVNDSSGKYHLQRSAEAFHDLADIIGIDPKDVSLNGRLAIAFGARGSGTSLAHYEPDRKVINMTKYGGAGSLAHEWGHAMDNILYQYSHGGKESMGLASNDTTDIGSNDPKLKALYENMMDAIHKPAPGDKGAYKTITLDSSKSPTSRYYPEMRRQIQSDMAPEDIYHHWQDKINQQYDRYVNNAKNNSLRSPEDKEKAVKSYERKRSRELNDLTKYLAKELELKQNGGKYRGEPYKGDLKIATGNSEYYQRMLETSPGKKQNGSHYWSQGCEMFARVFESYVQDKLDKQKRYNNYLVHGTREKDVKAFEAPFPIGKERTHMFKAMDNLMKHIASKGTLKKALVLEILASGHGDMTEELRKSLGYTKRSAYNVANPEEVIYIPVNRLKVVYQTDKATNWDKVNENLERMKAGENLEPVSIGLDYDIHDGHHRYEASKLGEYEHIPCVVKGGNELERQRAIEAYREVWKSIIKDPASEQPYEGFENDAGLMFRGIGQKELDYIRKHGHVMTKGKGNDEDKARSTCFSNLYSQAVGYAKSNYDLYNEELAYVIALPKPNWVTEDETGELIADRPVPTEGMMVIPIPRESA